MTEPPGSKDPVSAKADATGGGGRGHRIKGQQNIIVGMRVRPLNAKEKERSAWVCVDVLDHENVLVNDPDDKMGGLDYLRLNKTKTMHYCFDYAFGPDATQQEVYDKCTKSLALKAVEGYNACCFAYGASTRALFA